MTNHKFIFLISFLTFSLSSFASSSDSLKKKNEHFELSFGQSLLFISSSKQINIRNQSAVVVPTSSVLFFAEFRPQKIMRVPVFFNLATESKQFIVNGQMVNERASPTFGTGVIFKMFQIRIDSTSKVEFEAGPLSSFIFNKGNHIRAVPVLAGRFRVMRGTNFVMYIGVSYSFGINALGILYGTGTIF